MARLIGMDEAGLGPNLGPFVVAVTVWDVPDSPRTFDFWKIFADVLTNEPANGDPRLHVADSKQVFQPQRGFAALERGVFAALKLSGHAPRSYRELCDLLIDGKIGSNRSDSRSAWYHDAEFVLPTEEHENEPVRAWADCCERHRIRLVSIRAAIIEAREFNQMIRDYDNKSLVVSRTAFRLLRSVWDPHEADAFVVGDKHGGRNRYDELLAEVLDGDMIFRQKEGADRSEYKVGKSLLRFQPRAEEHGPVALASMTAKYVRELAMAQFNRFWARHIDGLKPTQGYPVDAQRFKADIAEAQKQLAIDDDNLWRCR